jgi:hypothetical protein
MTNTLSATSQLCYLHAGYRVTINQVAEASRKGRRALRWIEQNWLKSWTRRSRNGKYDF